MRSNRHRSQSSRGNKSSKSVHRHVVAEFLPLEPRQLLSAVPALSSRPGATQKLYLDFDGDYTATWGTYHPNSTPAYDSDGNASSFSAGEISNIQQIWARVAEKYSPFNIDVTTIDPGNYNDKQAFRIVIGGSGGWAGGGSGGITWINAYNNAMPNTGYVFSANLAGGTPQYVGDAIAHESGHGFGLSHQSSYSGTTRTAAYNKGNSATAPLMGNSYYAARGIWWYGQSESGFNVYQDDLAVLGNSIGYRSDDVGNWVNSAARLSLSGTSASASGVIERTTDSDFFSFSTGGGNVSFTASPSATGGMLDLKLSLYNSSGSLVASANTASLGESLSSYLSAGTYYIAVASKGNYGDLGQYSLSGNIGTVGGSTGGTTSTPYAPSNASASSSSSSQVNLSWADNSSNETGFKIERMTDGGSWSQVATVGANVTTYVDSGLSAYTNYAYRVRATNSAGNSAYSNAVWVTTRKSGTTTTPSTPTDTSGGSVPAGTKLTGTPIGTSGSWNNQGNVLTKALDGNINSFFDSNVRDYATVGYDLGAGNARVISAIRYAPRSGQAGRMVGGKFQGSNDGVNWSTLYTITSQPAEGQYTTSLVGGSTAFRYVRYQAPAASAGNIAELEFYSTTGAVTNPGGNTTNGNGGTSSNMPSGSQIRGTAIGTAGSWNNQGNTFYKVFDGSLDTFFDAPTSQAWVGIDFGSKQYVASARFAPRSGWANRMVGGQFQVSNDGSSWTTVATITSQPAEGRYTTINFSFAGSYRYARYLSPQGGLGNLSELQFFSGTAASAEPVVITNPPSGETTEAHATPIFSALPIQSDVLGADAVQVL